MRIQFFLIASYIILALGAITPVQVSAQDAADDLPTNKTTTQQVGDWAVSCKSGEGTAKSCAMIQQLSGAKSKQVVLAWLIGLNDKGQQVMTLRTPLGLLLQKGVVVKVDDMPELVMSFRTCVQSFCEAVHALKASILDTLRRGKTAVVRLHNLQEREVVLKVSLKGFSKAYRIFSSELNLP